MNKFFKKRLSTNRAKKVVVIALIAILLVSTFAVFGCKSSKTDEMNMENLESVEMEKVGISAVEKQQIMNSLTTQTRDSANTNEPDGITLYSADDVYSNSGIDNSAVPNTTNQPDSKSTLNAQSGDFTYEDNKITGYTGAGGDITIPNNLDGTDIYGVGFEAFKDNTFITSVTFEEGILFVDSSAFLSCTNLTSIYLPDTLQEIWYNAFGFTAITSITIPQNVYRIEPALFVGCDSLETISVDPGNMNFMIDGGALVSSNQVIAYPAARAGETYNVSDGIDSICPYAFGRSQNLTSVVLSETVRELQDYAFCGSSIAGTMNITQSVQNIGSAAFGDCQNLTSFSVDAENGNFEVIDDVLFGYGNGLAAYPTGKTSTTYVVPDNVIWTANGAFLGCTNLTQVTLNTDLETIGNATFSGCTNISSMTLNPFLRYIGEYAFDNTGFTSVELPKMPGQITNWVDTAEVPGTYQNGDTITDFALSYYIESQSDTSEDANHPGYIFHQTDKLECEIYVYNNSGIQDNPETVVIPETLDGLTVVGIQENAFSGCETPLENVTINDSTRFIGAGAFMDNNIDTLVLNNNLEQIEPGAFRSNSLSSVTIPDSVVVIAEETFVDNQIITLTLGNSVEVIGFQAFYGEAQNNPTGNKITEVVLPNSLTSLGDNAFAKNALTSITIPGNLEVVSNGCFMDNPLVTVTVQEGVEEISDGAFQVNSNDGPLTDNALTLPDSLNFIGYGAFSGTQIGDITDNPDDEVGTGFTLPGVGTNNWIGWEGETYSSGDAVVTQASYFKNGNITGGFAYKTTAYGTVEIYRYLGNATSVVVPNEIDGKYVTGISAAAFIGGNLTSITLPERLQGIGPFAFAFNDIRSITIPTLVSYIGIGAFNENDSFNGVTLPEIDYAYVQWQAFNDDGTPYVDENDNEVFYEEGGFIAAEDLGAANHSTCTWNDEYAYHYNEDDQIIIDYMHQDYDADPQAATNDYVIHDQIYFEDVIGIGQGAFGDKEFDSVVIPETVSFIDPDAFYGNEFDDPSDAVLPDNLEFIGSGAFADNDENFYFELPAPDGQVTAWIDLTNEDGGFLYGGDAIGGDGIYGEYLRVNAGENFFGTREDNGGLYITDYAGLSANVVIPDTIDNQPVIGIDFGAFFDHDELKSVTIPASIEDIVHNPFAFCNNMTKFVVNTNNPFYKSVSGILMTKDGESLISYPAKKTGTSYTVNNREIRHGAFSNSKYLTKVNISSNLSSYGGPAFFDAQAIRSFAVSDDNQSFSDNAGCLIFNNESRLLSYPLGSTNSSFEIPEGIYSIDSCAFYNANHLEEIIFPDSLRRIENSAFEESSLNQGVQLPLMLEYIGQGAFRGTNVNDLTLPDMPSYYVEWYKNEEEQVLAEGTVIDDFDAYYHAENIEFQQSCGDFEYRLDWDDSGVPIACFISNYTGGGGNIEIESSLNGLKVIGIDHYALADKGITSVTLPDGLQYIEEGAFENNSLTDITIPNSVDFVGNGAFLANNIATFTLSDAMDNIPAKMFYQNALINITIPDHIQVINGEAFADNGTQVLDLSGADSLVGIEDYAFSNHSLTALDIPNSVEYLGEGAFYAFMSGGSFETITLGSGLESIGKNAFNGNSNLQAIPQLPDNMKYVGMEAFNNTQVATIQLPDGSAWSDGRGNSFNGGDVVPVANDDAFTFYAKNDGQVSNDYIYTDNGNGISILKYIGNDTTVIVPDEIDDLPVTIIDVGAFVDKGLTSVTLPKDLEQILSEAFYNNSLNSVQLPENVRHIGFNAFDMSVQLPIIANTDTSWYGQDMAQNDYVELVGGDATPDSTYEYYRDQVLNHFITEYWSYEVTNESGEVIESSMDLYVLGYNPACQMPADLVIPAVLYGGEVYGIATDAFCDRGIDSLELPNTLVSVEQYAFSNNNLQDLRLPDDLEYIGNNAFGGNTIKQATLNSPDDTHTSWVQQNYNNEILGTYEDGDLIDLEGDFYYYIAGAEEREFSFDKETGTITGYNGTSANVEIPDEIEGVAVNIIGEGAFRGNTRIREVFIQGENLTSIDCTAFESCSNLLKIYIPGSVTEINDVFVGCAKLSQINIVPSSTPETDTYASLAGVLYNREMTRLILCPKAKPKVFTLPQGVTEIDNGAFFECKKITKIVLPDGLLTIGQGAFADCAILSYVTIPDSITAIPDYAFSGCRKLKSVDLGNGVTTIGNNAFENCAYLPSITIPNSVETISDSVFSGCSKLKTARIPASVTSMGSNVFENAYSKLKIYGTFDSASYDYAQANDITFVVDIAASLETTIEGQGAEGACDPIEAGEDTVLTATIVGIPDGEQARYTLKYSTNGGKSYKSVSGYIDEPCEANIPISWTTPTSKSDKTYTYKIEVSIDGYEGFDTSNELEQLVYSSYPINAVTLYPVSDGAVASGIGVMLRATATNYDGSKAESAQYQFYYKDEESSKPKWVKIGKPNTTGYTFFKPKKEGIYSFKVEVAKVGRSIKNFDASDETKPEEYVMIYLDQKPLSMNEMIDLTVDESALDNAISGITLTADVTKVGSGEAVDAEFIYYYKLATSTKWIKINKYHVQGEYKFYPKKDGDYNFKVLARALGRKVQCDIEFEDAQAYAVTRIPAEEVNGVNIITIAEILPSAGGNLYDAKYVGVEFTAQAIYDGEQKAETEYRFQYSMNGGGKWYSATKYFGEATQTLKFKKSGNYLFRVQARTKGQNETAATSEASSEFVVDIEPKEIVLSNSVLIDMSEYPIGTPIDDAKYGITLTAQATPESNEYTEDIEYMFYYKFNPDNPRSKWVKVSKKFGESTQIFKARKNGYYIFKVEAKTKGRKYVSEGRVSNASEVYELQLLPTEKVQSVLFVEAGMISPIYGAKSGTSLTAVAFSEPDLAGEDITEDSEFRFSYQLNGGSKWYYVNSKFGDSVQTFKAKKNGDYIFRVEARTKRRTNTDPDNVDLSNNGYQVFVNAENEIDTVEVMVDPSDHNDNTTFYNGESATVTINARAGQDYVDDFEYTLYYKLNGGSKLYPLIKKYKKYAFGSNTYEFTPSKTGEYVFVAKARGVGTKTIVSSESIPVTMSMLPVPVDGGEGDFSFTVTPINDNSTVRIETSASIDGVAVEQSDAEYAYFYRINYTDGQQHDDDGDWYMIGGEYTEEPSVEFDLPESGDYDFIVQARATGRPDYDAADMVSQSGLVESGNALPNSFSMESTPDSIEEFGIMVEPEPTPEPTSEPTPAPSEEPAPEPEPQPEPAEEPTPVPSEEPTSEPSEEPQAEPSEEPEAESADEPEENADEESDDAESEASEEESNEESESSGESDAE